MTLQGDMASMYADQDIAALQDESLKDYLTREMPVYYKLKLEQEYRKTKRNQ